MGVVGLTEYDVLTPFLLFTEEDPDFVPDDAEYGYRSAPNLACGTGPVEMPPLSQYSEPVVDPMWFAVWCYVVVWLIIIIICIECPPRFVRF